MDEIYTIVKNMLNSKGSDLSVFKRGFKRRTWIQESGGLTISFFLSLFLGSFTPFFCNLAHCILDWCSYYKSNPLAPFYNKLETRGFIKTFSIEELIITVFLFIIYINL